MTRRIQCNLDHSLESVTICVILIESLTIWIVLYNRIWIAPYNLIESLTIWIFTMCVTLLESGTKVHDRRWRGQRYWSLGGSFPPSSPLPPYTSLLIGFSIDPARLS